MMNSVRQWILGGGLIIASLVLASCASSRLEPVSLATRYADLGDCALNDERPSVMTRKALKREVSGPVGAQAKIERSIAAGNDRLEAGASEEAMGHYLAALREADRWMRGATPERWPFLFRMHAYATARLVESLGILESGGVRSRTLSLPGGGKIALKVSETKGEGRVDPYVYQSLEAADRYRLVDFGASSPQAGWGAPFIGWRAASDELDGGAAAFFPEQGLYQALTALVHFRQGGAELAFYDVLLEDGVALEDGREVPLAVDVSSAWARQVDADPYKKAILGMLRPGKMNGVMRLSFTEPFREDRIPVVFVHGLASHGATWDRTINGLLAHPEIREKYQFWLYQYPSGYPFIYPAAELRRTLRDVRQSVDPQRRLPALDNMVLVGHSMGGLISSVQVRRTDDEELHRLLKRPISEMDADASTKERLRDFVAFQPDGHVRRVVFIATPHRGSTIADGWVGRLFARLIELPNDIVSLNFKGMVQELTDTGMSLIDLAPNSVMRLQYYNPALKTLASLPFDDRVAVHTIVGDRGLGNAPHSSDGVVSYTSSFLQAAQSEHVVPSWHSAHRHPEAIAELQRILLDHLQP